MLTPTLRPIRGLLALALLIAGCAPLLPMGFPTQSPDAIPTIVAQTAAAAATQTAAALPTATFTPTITLTPTETPIPPTETPTPTPTFIFVLATDTATPTIESGGTVGSSTTYRCIVLAQTPPNGTTLAPNTDFDWMWRVENTGTRTWGDTEVDYRYLSGDRFHKKEIYDLPRDVYPGETIELIVDMIAPGETGTYTTTWSLRVGKKTFCPVTLTINVQ